MKKFNSRRSTVYARHGMVASTQPLASEIGLSVLKAGGNAADAAVAVAAALNVTEPTSTGIGGDMFCLYFDASTKEVRGLNSSGRCPAALNIDILREQGIADNALPLDSVHCVTVPGAAMGWAETLNMFGTRPLAEVLAPAIALAEEGFPVHPCAAHMWQEGEYQLRRGPHGDEMLLNGKPPKAGEIMTMPHLAETFRELAAKGPPGFYEGRIAEEIVKVVQELGGVLTLEDLKQHTATEDDPIHVNYHGVDVYEIPPNGQGIAALIGLNIIENIECGGTPGTTQHFHAQIEAMRMAFADTRHYCADPRVVDVPIEGLLAKEYGQSRAAGFDPAKATVDVKRGSPENSSNTVYFSVVDGDGNACSFINSNYHGFGSGIIPKHCGFTLQNRGANFSLDPAHPNCLAPHKRPYHTIIPGMALKDGELYCCFGVMGGFMQPQGHLQVMMNCIDFGMDPQEALDFPRFCIDSGESDGRVCIEDGIPDDVLEQLRSMGHVCERVAGNDRAVFGCGQMIFRNPSTGVLSAGSDPRGDGAAVGW